MKTTKKEIIQVFKNNDININEINHDLIAAKKAANYMVNDNNINAIDIIKLVFFNKPIPEIYTHSYGFHTRQGREIINQFKNLYYNYDN